MRNDAGSGSPPLFPASYYFICFSISATAAACCFCASCATAYFCTAYVTPRLTEMSTVKPKRKRVNEPRGDGAMG